MLVLSYPTLPLRVSLVRRIKLVNAPQAVAFTVFSSSSTKGAKQNPRVLLKGQHHAILSNTLFGG